MSQPQTIYEQSFTKPKKINTYWATELIEISKTGYYAIEITALCRNRAQNLVALSTPLDDDLRIRIDDRNFPKLNAKQGLFNTPAGFNGTDQDNGPKTNIFICYFEKGTKFPIEFFGRRSPRLKEIKVYSVAVEDNEISFSLNTQAEDKDKRIWFTFILIDIVLKAVSITASCEKRKRDSDDLKIVIDHKIQYNLKKRWWGRQWYFRGAELQGESKTADFFVESNKYNLHYIEIWADRMPRIEEVVFQIEPEAIEDGESKEEKKDEDSLPDSKIVLQYYRNNKLPNNDYNRFDKEIIEAVNYWNNDFAKQKYPPSEPLDPNLVKAMIYHETGMGYHKGPNKAYPDVMQIGNYNPNATSCDPDDIGDATIPILNNTGICPTEYEYCSGQEKALDYKSKANADAPEQSIHWGVRWLYHKAQKVKKARDKKLPYGFGKWVSWKQAVAKYGPPKPSYVKEIWNLYKKGIDKHGNILWTSSKETGFTKIKVALLCCLFIMLGLIAISTVFFLSRYKNKAAEIAESKHSNVFDELNNETEEMTEMDKLFQITDEIHEAQRIAIEQREHVLDKVGSLMIESLQAYQYSNLQNYGDVFKKPFDLCNKDNNDCHPDLVFPLYMDDLVDRMHSNNQLVQAATVLELIQDNNFFRGNIDEDDDQEIVIVKPRYFGTLDNDTVKIDGDGRTYFDQEASSLWIINKENNVFKLYYERIEQPRISSVRVEELTGDKLSEILFFTLPDRFGGNLHIVQFRDTKIKQMFVIDDFVYPHYTFTDKNGVTEVTMAGKDPCDYGALVSDCKDMPHQGVLAYSAGAFFVKEK